MLQKLWNRFLASPVAGILLIVGLSIVAAQISAMAMVVQGQVQRAQLRESLRATGQMALADCMRNNHKAASAESCSSVVAVAMEH